MTGGAFTQTALGGAAGGNVVVVLSLRGGADGLSLAVPYGDAGLRQGSTTPGNPDAVTAGQGQLLRPASKLRPPAADVELREDGSGARCRAATANA